MPEPDYLGQAPPGRTAQLFHGGKLVEHPDGEKRSFNLAFSPDGNELFFSYYKGTGEVPHPEYEIKTFVRESGRWIGPSTAAFSGQYSDVDINFSPDGRYLFFASDRPMPESAGLDIY
jgi:Tol biopolymer transport system component